MRRLLTRVIPREPILGIGFYRFRVRGESQQVVEGIDAVEVAGVDYAHEAVADFRPMDRLVEKAVFAMQDRALYGLLANVMPPPDLCRVQKLERQHSELFSCRSRLDARHN